MPSAYQARISSRVFDSPGHAAQGLLALAAAKDAHAGGCQAPSIFETMLDRSSDPSQPQLPRAVLSEQTPIPNVPPNHLNAPVPGLVHDGPLRSPSNGRRRCMARPQ